MTLGQTSCLLCESHDVFRGVIFFAQGQDTASTESARQCPMDEIKLEGGALTPNVGPYIVSQFFAFDFLMSIVSVLGWPLRGHFTFYFLACAGLNHIPSLEDL